MGYSRISKYECQRLQHSYAFEIPIYSPTIRILLVFRTLLAQLNCWLKYHYLGARTLPRTVIYCIATYLHLIYNLLLKSEND